MTPTHLSRWRLSAVVAGGCLATLGLVGVQTASAGAASTAFNPYSPAVAHPYRHGVVPTIPQLAKMK
ncbi:MAG TPA: hypothetical protein VNF71_13230, partial [Acidimicrobiales bacterium]|nr:hypothetical protein [Acidimicrobiales bacterium]